MIESFAQKQSYNGLNTRDISQTDKDKLDRKQTTAKQNNAGTVCIFLGMYCPLAVQMRSSMGWRVHGKYAI